MRYLLLALTLGFLHLTCRAQNATRSVLASAGELQTKGDIRLSSTLGEAFTSTLKASSSTAISGFHARAKVESVTVYSLRKFNHKVIAYPNPFSDLIQVRTDAHSEILSLELYGPDGRLIRSVSGMNLIETGDLLAGYYLLHLEFAGGSFERIPIVKP